MSKSFRIARGIVVAIPALTAIAFVGLGISRSSAEIARTIQPCTGLSSEIGGPDAGGFSQSTGEQLDQGYSIYMVANVERQDGQVHPTFGPFPRGVYVFKTTSGRHVVRVLDLPPNHGWYGPY